MSSISNIYFFRLFTSSPCTSICPISFSFSSRFSFLSMLSKIFFRVGLQQRQGLSHDLHRFFETFAYSIYFLLRSRQLWFLQRFLHCKFNFSCVFELANYKCFHCSSCKPIANVVGIRAQLFEARLS